MTEPAAPNSPPPVANPALGPQPVPRRRRALWIALIASLGVNLFLVGWVASSWVYGPRFSPGGRTSASTGMPFKFRSASRAISGEDRQAAQRVWRERLPELRLRVAALRQAHGDMRSAFTADQADAKAMTDAVAAFKDKANGLFDQVNATLIAIAAALPPDARKAYFDAGFPRPRARGERRGRERRER